jgi:hypothetical protein
MPIPRSTFRAIFVEWKKSIAALNCSRCRVSLKTPLLNNICRSQEEINPGMGPSLPPMESNPFQFPKGTSKDRKVRETGESNLAFLCRSFVGCSETFLN